MTKTLKNIFKSIAISLMMVMLFSCENDINTIKSFSDNSDKPIESTYNASMTMTELGRVKVRLSSPQVDHYKGEKHYMELPKGLHLYFYDTAGDVNSELTARYAISYIEENTMEAKHDVVASNIKNEKLYTERLIWDQDEHIIHTDEKVKIVTDGEVIEGIGMTADEDFTNWEILKVTGTFEIDDPDNE
jgi:LPS export ABC transporter protein LptC